MEWTVELVRGTKDNRKWIDNEVRAHHRMYSLADLHGLKPENIVVNRKERHILVDASDYYAD